MADYEVGYKKPPVRTRFQKGRSGNPGGKRKPTANIAIALERTLGAVITVREHGETRSVSRLEAALDHLMAKATAGDTSAFRLLSALMQAYQEPPETSANDSPDLEAADEKILQKLLSQFDKPKHGDTKA